MATTEPMVLRGRVEFEVTLSEPMPESIALPAFGRWFDQIREQVLAEGLTLSDPRFAVEERRQAMMRSSLHLSYRKGG